MKKILRKILKRILMWLSSVCMGDFNLVKKLREQTGVGILACQKALKDANDNYDEALDLLRKQGIAKAVSKADRVTSEGLCCLAHDDKFVVVIKLCCETDFVSKNEKFQEIINKIANIALKTRSRTLDELMKQSVDGVSVNDLIVSSIASIGENIVLSDVVAYDVNDDERAVFYIHNKVNDNCGSIICFTISKGCDDSADLLLKQINMHIAAMSPVALNDNQIPEDILVKERAIYEEQVASLNKPSEIAKKMVDGKMRKFFEENVLLRQTFVIDNKNSIADVIADFNKENGKNLTLVGFKRVSIK